MKEVQVVDKKLFTAKELASVLCLSVPSVHRYVRTGKIPAKTIGRLRRFDRDEVLVALDDNRERKSSDDAGGGDEA
ncbi:MAG TPA: helix-turn-helix domain-containing protein [bacterium]|nr:helix-turn-helix domain-containing protein [bacterium]